MPQLKTLEEVADVLGEGGPHASDQTFATVGDLVDALVDLGNTDAVFARHDDHLSLKDDLPDSFLNASLDQAAAPRFAAEREQVLEQANIITRSSVRHLSEDDQDEINEDRAYRGASPNR